MDKIGIIKEIDSLGRLQIPKDIRTRRGKNKPSLVREGGFRVAKDG